MSEKIKEIVKETYTKVVTTNSACCGPSCCTPEVETTFSLDYKNVEGYEPDADYALGCGIPTQHAKIQPGDTVLDLGSGAGNDVFVARSLVGETGKVIGVDMTEAMVARAKKNKAKLDFQNVEFLLGEIEDLPLAENTIDVAISNCVLNLVPDKKKAYSEVYRVLKPGGHFSISDIVIEGELTEKIRNVAVLYAGCVSGALTKVDYLDAIKQAGFTNIKIPKELETPLSDELLLAYLSKKDVEEFRASGARIFSITVYGEK